MPIYMNYKNLGVKGDVTESKHKDWIRSEFVSVGRGPRHLQPDGRQLGS